MKDEAWLIVFKIVEFKDVLIEGIVRIVALGVLYNDSAPDSLQTLFNLVFDGCL